MSMQQKISEDDRHKLTFDDMNERCQFEEWRCTECDEWTDDDDVVWATEDGELDTDKGKPYCCSCVPEYKVKVTPDEYTCDYCGTKCWEGDGCDEHNADGFNKEE